MEDKLVINPSVNDMVSEWTLGLLICISVAFGLQFNITYCSTIARIFKTMKYHTPCNGTLFYC